MKTLIVKYLPTGAESKTKMLLDLFLQEIDGKNIETVDLLKEEIPTFNEKAFKPITNVIMADKSSMKKKLNF